MMKVTRQNISENYTITSGWVRDFANNIEKKSDFLSNVRDVFKKRHAPKTIDEKMADIKARVGYGIIKSDSNIQQANIKEANNGDCACCSGCSSNLPCESKGSDDTELIRLITQLIAYIKDFLSDRPEISSGAVLDHCKKHPDLSWNLLSPRMDHEKLKHFINSQINIRDSSHEPVKYISHDHTGAEPEDTTPEFMRGPSL
jgi:hypothetical protein